MVEQAAMILHVVQLHWSVMAEANKIIANFQSTHFLMHFPRWFAELTKNKHMYTKLRKKGERMKLKWGLKGPITHVSEHSWKSYDQTNQFRSPFALLAYLFWILMQMCFFICFARAPNTEFLVDSIRNEFNFDSSRSFATRKNTKKVCKENCFRFPKINLTGRVKHNETACRD